MRCPHCQHENAPGARRCAKCAARLGGNCVRCGNQLSATAKFCSECAQPVSEPTSASVRFGSPNVYTPTHLAERILRSRAALEGERKQVTVLFADLKGSMEMLADRDPEEARNLIDPVLERMIEAVHQYEGVVNQIMGDGIMALFGAPLAHEDHAIRACYAALDMQARIRSYTEEVRRTHGCEIQIRVGLHSGEVVVRAISNDLHMDYSAVGQTTHLAARMEQLASPGSVRLTADTLRLSEGFVEVRSLGPMPIKGMVNTVEVFELVGATATRTRLQAAAARGLTPFVGRQRELEQLGRRLTLAEAGHGQVVAVVGEAGVGKSRLFYEFTRSDRMGGWLVIETGSASYAKSGTYRPLIHLLKAYLGIQGLDDLRQAREKLVGKLLTLDEAFQLALPAFLTLLDIPVEDSRWRLLDASSRRRQTLEAVQRVFVRESQLRPVLLVFEDLHWIDAETQAFLDLLVEDLPAARVLLLVNYRQEYEHAWAGLSHYTQLRIDPLPRRTADELVTLMLGVSPSLDALKQLLIERTDANPLFLEESVRALVEAGSLVGVPGDYRLAQAVQRIQVPPTVQAVLAGRIDRLPLEEKRLLQCAAVLGKDVPYRLLRRIVEAPEDTLRRGLAHLCAAEFLHEASLFPQLEYSFRHSLTHEVAYGSLLHERRRSLHAAIVHALEMDGADGSAEHVERLAHHAEGGELWDKAHAYLRQAGARAFGHSAQGAAASWFERALAVLDRLTRTPETIELAIDLRLDLRYALIPLGHSARILACLREAEALALEVGDQRRLALIYSFLTNYYQVSGDPRKSIDYGERALAFAQAHADLAAEVTSTAFLASAFFTVGNYAQTIDLAQRNLRLLQGERAHARFGMANLPAVYTRLSLSRALAETGRFGEGLGVGEEALRIAEKAGHTVSVPLGWFAIGYVLLCRGELAGAIRALERAGELSRSANVIWFRHIASTLAGAYALTGRPTEALDLVREAGEQAEAMGLAGSPLGHGVRLLAQTQALLRSDQLDRAVKTGQEAIEFLQSIGARGFVAWGLRLMGIVAMGHAPAETGQAESFLRQALSLAEELGMKPLVSHCRLGLGALFLRAGRHDRAQSETLAALTLYRALDMPYWAQQAERQLTQEVSS